ncbi:MAG TPA: hypothetical protein VFJ81_06965 [Gemmatimonadales bacterium]|nr:hypothetical protein [Gemmatimonadales bacterium]
MSTTSASAKVKSSSIISAAMVEAVSAGAGAKVLPVTLYTTRAAATAPSTWLTTYPTNSWAEAIFPRSSTASETAGL